MNEHNYNQAKTTQKTLINILNDFDRVEIPIIQRDYAQGRESAANIRESFLKNIFDALKNNVQVELDFIYGYKKNIGNNKSAFIPIDGQQRLTTLWLLHWFLAAKAGGLGNISEKLSKFVYETRESTQDFLNKLCSTEGKGIDPSWLARGFKDHIINDAPWFEDAWRTDPSIMGFLTMLESIANQLDSGTADPKELLHRLVEGRKVVFYCVELEKFSLGEEIYTRMNARGKQLTPFEKIKSMLYKVTSRFPVQHNDLAAKMDSSWVEDFWDYRDKDHLVDTSLTNYLLFVTRMLYVQRPNLDLSHGTNLDSLNTKVLELIYSDKKNLEFLIHAFDNVKILKDAGYKIDFEWKNKPGLKVLLKDEILDKSNPSPVASICIYAALLFLEKDQNPVGLDDFLRVVRNLVGNTQDRTERNWPTMINTLKSLLATSAAPIDIYTILRKPGIELTGFRRAQQKAEIFKASLEVLPDAKQLIVMLDENVALKARIFTIFERLYQDGGIKLKNTVVSSSSRSNTMSDDSLSSLDPATVDLGHLGKLLDAYDKLRTYKDSKDFEAIWGDLLATSMYLVKYDTCFIHPDDNSYSDCVLHPEVMLLSSEVVKSKSVDDTLLERERDFIKKMESKYNGNLIQSEDVREQLYMLYIFNTRVKRNKWEDFFKGSRWNFGWQDAENSYLSPFPSLLRKPNQVFQTYDSQFRKVGIRYWRTPDVLLDGAHDNFQQELLKVATAVKK